MLTPLHVTRGISIFEIETLKEDTSIHLLAEDGNTYNLDVLYNDSKKIYRQLNEIIACFLLDIWNLNAPALGQLHTPPSILNGHKNVPANLKTSFRTGKQLLGIRTPKNIIPFNTLMDDPHYWSYKSLSKPLDLIKVALFDCWVANEGRIKSNTDLHLFFINDGNEKLNLFSWKHALIFGDFEFQNLSKNYLNKDHLQILNLNLAKKTIQMLHSESIVSALEEYYKKAVNTSLFALDQIFDMVKITNSLSSKEEKSIREFLGNKERTSRVFSEFRRKLKT